MAVVHLVRALTPGDRDLLRVHDHHEVPGVDVRGVRGLALAAQGVGNLGRQTAEGLPFGVDDEPIALAVRGFGDVGFHSGLWPRAWTRHAGCAAARDYSEPNRGELVSVAAERLVTI